MRAGSLSVCPARRTVPGTVWSLSKCCRMNEWRGQRAMQPFWMFFFWFAFYIRLLKTRRPWDLGVTIKIVLGLKWLAASPHAGCPWDARAQQDSGTRTCRRGLCYGVHASRVEQEPEGEPEPRLWTPVISSHLEGVHKETPRNKNREGGSRQMFHISLNI